MSLNRKQRRAQQVIQHEFIQEMKLTDAYEEIPRSEWPLAKHSPYKIWRNRHFLVQLWGSSLDVMRLSVVRVKVNMTGRYQENITWDELQQVKRDLGYGEFYAVEVYPRDSDIVNVQNMRHLWLMEEPLPIGWFK